MSEAALAWARRRLCHSGVQKRVLLALAEVAGDDGRVALDDAGMLLIAARVGVSQWRVAGCCDRRAEQGLIGFEADQSMRLRMDAPAARVRVGAGRP